MRDPRRNNGGWAVAEAVVALGIIAMLAVGLGSVRESSGRLNSPSGNLPSESESTGPPMSARISPRMQISPPSLL